MEGLILKLEQERRREVAALAEDQPVSRFPFRGRIQSLIRLRSLRQEVAIIRHQQRSQKLETERCQSGSNHLLLKDTSTQEQNVTCNWLSKPCNSKRRWRMIRENFNNFTDNVEIRELLERKTVSTSLASGFCAKMNQMLISFLHRQEQQYVDENDREKCEEEIIWKQNYESSSDQEAMASSPAPSSSESSQNQESWTSTSFSQNSSTRLQEATDMHDLKNNISRIHREVSELKKLVESFLEWQKKLECSIKLEVSSTVDQLCGTEKLMKDFNWMPRRKDTCCICCEAQVDSLFYRCGHMAACYKCAQELQWSSGRCPICRSMIVDVVRAYRNS